MLLLLSLFIVLSNINASRGIYATFSKNLMSNKITIHRSALGFARSAFFLTGFPAHIFQSSSWERQRVRTLDCALKAHALKALACVAGGQLPTVSNRVRLIRMT